MIGIKNLKKLAVDIVDGKVFGSWEIKNADLVGSVFMPLMFMNEEQRIEDKNVAHYYEYMDRASSMTINGMPAFSSMRKITKEELDIIIPLVEEYKNKKKEFIND